MNDPYAVLGVSSSASEEEIKRAYRDLVKKYHPDNYANNPLADLAEAKMKEVNEAYDAIMKARTQGGYQSAGGNGYGGGRTSSQGGGRYNNPTLIQVRQLIAQNNLAEAERILRSTPANNGEWYYLMGSIAYRPGLDGRCPPEFLDRLQHGPQQHGVPSGHEQYGDAGPTGNLWRGRRYCQPLYHPVLPQLSVQFVQRLTAHGRKMRMRCLA